MKKTSPRETSGRERIIAAAIRELGEKGYDAAGIRDIAAEAGMALGALYRHFKGKDDLAREIYATSIRSWSERLKESAEQHDHPAERLDAMVRFFSAAFDAEPQHGPARRFSARAANPLKVVQAELERASARREILPGNLEARALVVLGAVLQPAAAYSRAGKTGLAGIADEISAAAIRAAGITPKGKS